MKFVLQKTSVQGPEASWSSLPPKPNAPEGPGPLGGVAGLKAGARNKRALGNFWDENKVFIRGERFYTQARWAPNELVI